MTLPQQHPFLEAEMDKKKAKASAKVKAAIKGCDDMTEHDKVCMAACLLAEAQPTETNVCHFLDHLACECEEMYDALKEHAEGHEPGESEEE